MSNILIIKHGSLGDIVQISGVIRDIREANKDKKIFILTTLPYAELLGRCPYLDGVLIDKRLPRWNILYLLKLKKKIKSFNFSYIYDLQNSSRTYFYKKFLFRNIKWSNTETTLNPGEKKSDFDKEPVLDRFKLQLEKSIWDNGILSGTFDSEFSIKLHVSGLCENEDSGIKNKRVIIRILYMYKFVDIKIKCYQYYT